MTFFVERLAGWVAPSDVFTSFYADLDNSFWLDREFHHSERFSTMGTGNPASQSEIAAILGRTRPESSSADYPFGFRPGLVGVMSFDEGVRNALAGTNYEHTGGVALRSAPVAESKFLMVDRAIVFDHDSRQLFFVAELGTDEEFRDWYHAALLRLALVGGSAKSWSTRNPKPIASRLDTDFSEIEYRAAVDQAKRSIALGDSYQICLTNRLTGDYQGHPSRLFIDMRSEAAAPYGGYFKMSKFELACFSPELLLAVSGNLVASSPIKGTRPRMSGRADLEVADELRGNEKERAENLMIVDLLRNDLQRVCLPDSVTVSELLEVYSYSSVHHLVSSVNGHLLPGASLADVIASCFPAGSMSGAPKLSSLAVIQELERSQRAYYAGGFGYITNQGGLELGMVIRSAVFNEGRVQIGAGGGLTSDSEPSEEFAEMKLKASKLLHALGASVDW